MKPYYTIPSRNLFRGKFDEDALLKLFRIVRFIRRRGPAILFRCGKLARGHSCLTLNTGLLLELSEKRKELEMLVLNVNFISTEQKVPLRASVTGIYEPEDISDEEIMWIRICDLIWPGWRTDMAEKMFDTYLIRYYINSILS